MVTLDEEGYVEADIRLGAFPGRQKVRVAVGKLSITCQILSNIDELEKKCILDNECEVIFVLF